MSQNQPTTTSQPISPIAPIDPQLIVEHGESATTIILSIAVLISVLVRSLTGLVRVIAITLLHQKRSSR